MWKVREGQARFPRGQFGCDIENGGSVSTRELLQMSKQKSIMGALRIDIDESKYTLEMH